MQGFSWGLLITPLTWIPSAITAVACTLYARRNRSRAAVSLAVAASGTLLVLISSSLFSRFVLPRALSSTGSSTLLLRSAEAFTTMSGVLAIALALIFSISLLLVLRDATSGGKPSSPV